MPPVTIVGLNSVEQRLVAQFLAANGYKVPNHELACILGLTEDDVGRIKGQIKLRHVSERKSYVDLFSMWRGRAPSDEEWPLPRRVSSNNSYEWQVPEITLLASLVGRVGPGEIAAVLTARLQKITGDVTAERTKAAVINAQRKTGLQSGDVVDGITIAEAGARAGSDQHVRHAIRIGDLPASKVGRLLVIPRPAFEAWLEKRKGAPEGYVQLSTLRERLGIQSDKLSEFARAGLIPSAIRCKVYGANMRTTQFGTWFVSSPVADKLLADRKKGLPMPWHGKGLTDNLSRSFELWKQRRHPKSCKTCAEIWGKRGAPKTFADYKRIYPGLTQGAKRHLTKPWTPGLSLNEVAEKVGTCRTQVKRAVEAGLLSTQVFEGKHYVSRTEAVKWKYAGCPTGERTISWISLESAEKLYGFTRRQLRLRINKGELKSRIGEVGAQAGIEYVSKRQCAALRAKLGYSVQEAARRAGVSVEQISSYMKGLGWKKSDGVMLETIQEIVRRRQSERGFSINEAAQQLGQPVEWVQRMIEEGVVKVVRPKWQSERIYLTKPMLMRLKAAITAPVRPERLPDDWLRLSAAARDAGVTAQTLIKWALDGEVERRELVDGWRYHQPSLRRRANQYWASPVAGRYRKKPPAWLLEKATR